MRILVIEDNVDICANIDAFFSGRGWHMDFAYDGHSGLTLSLQNKYDLIVLDIAMPGLDGFEVCQRYRKASQYLTPIIMLTARDSLDDKVKGFDAGADDYLVKPFAMRELAMRLESLSRRPIVAAHQTKSIGNLEINRDSFTVRINQTYHEFRHLEHKLLWLLASEYPKTLEQSELCFQLWGEKTPDKHSLRTHIYNIRKALKGNGASFGIYFSRPNLYCLRENTQG